MRSASLCLALLALLAGCSDATPDHEPPGADNPSVASKTGTAPPLSDRAQAQNEANRIGN